MVCKYFGITIGSTAGGQYLVYWDDCQHRVDICMIWAKQFTTYAEDIPNDLTIIWIETMIDCSEGFHKRVDTNCTRNIPKPFTMFYLIFYDSFQQSSYINQACKCVICLESFYPKFSRIILRWWEKDWKYNQNSFSYNPVMISVCAGKENGDIIQNKTGQFKNFFSMWLGYIYRNLQIIWPRRARTNLGCFFENLLIS